nr:PEP/pyruvate-binding domain-containing protein [Streptomyces sp. SID4937]
MTRVTGDGPVAVRSPAIGEDTATATGQHDAFLGVSGPGEVAEAVRGCAASLWSERAVAYRRRTLGRPSSRSWCSAWWTPRWRGDVHRRRLRRTAGGVLGAWRERRRRGHAGLLTVSGTTVTRRTLGSKRTRIHRDRTGVVTREVAHADRERLCPTDDEVARLTMLGRSVAGLLGGERDIEWAIVGSRIWLLQARPVTGALPAEAAVPAAGGPGESGALTGSPGSAGSATGPARVVRGPGDFGRERPADVLVCRTTEPAWTPLFGIVAAVVTETGGLLSHAAIVARELGLPTVLAVADATEVLPDGAPVEVDGDTGRVALHGAG